MEYTEYGPPAVTDFVTVISGTGFSFDLVRAAERGARSAECGTPPPCKFLTACWPNMRQDKRILYSVDTKCIVHLRNGNMTQIVNLCFRIAKIRIIFRAYGYSRPAQVLRCHADTYKTAIP